MKLNEIFNDLKVIELSSVLAGPAVGMFFAELGAQVIKIENLLTGGDITRSWKLPSENSADEKSAYYHAANWNKEVRMLNLKESAAKSEVNNLIKDADIIISNFKVGSASKLGFDYPSLKKINPSIIYASITGYGENNANSGFDAKIQAETGWMHMNGEQHGGPTKVPIAIIDLMCAHQIKQGLLLALLHRNKTGEGSKVSCSLFEASVCSLANQASNWLNEQYNPSRKGSLHPNIAPYGEILVCQDNAELLLAIGTDKQFEKLCKNLKCPIIALDEKYSTNAQRVKYRTSLLKELQQRAKDFHSTELLNLLSEDNVPVSRINDMKRLFEYPLAKDCILEQSEVNGKISKRVKSIAFKLEI